MHVRIRKWGNSPAVRIPASVMAAAKLRIDQKVDIRTDEHGRVVLEPITDGFDLAAALAAITPDNLHAETDFGSPAGNEAW